MKTHTLKVLCTLALLAVCVTPPSGTAAASSSSSFSNALPSIAVLPPPLPVKKGDYRTISWISYANYQYSVDTSYIKTGSYTKTSTSTTNATSKDAFQYDTLDYAVQFPFDQLDQVRTSINAVTRSNPNFGNPAYKFSFQFWGHTDVRCDPTNVWSSMFVATYLQADSPCAVTDSPISFSNYTLNTPDPAIAPFSKNYDSGTFRQFSPSNASLSVLRAGNLRDQVRLRYDAWLYAGVGAGDWDRAEPFTDLYGAGEWFSSNTATTCRASTASCAPERVAELIIVQTHTYSVTTTEKVSQTSLVDGTSSSLVTSIVDCEYYGTCLAQPAITVNAPKIALQSFQQQGTRSLTIPAATVSCPGCKAPVSSGAPTTGWRATVESATLSGVSLTPPTSYTSPKHFSFIAPGSNLTSPQKITLKLNKATLAGSPYKLNPGTVTVTVRLDPWLWDGSRVTWLTSNTTRVKRTVPLTCSISTSCKFGVLGSNTAG